MLKTALIHFGSGIVMAISVLFITLLPESLHIAMYIPLSILMAIFYVWAGTFLKNESFLKVSLMTQTLAYIGHIMQMFNVGGKYLIALAGGAGIWNITLGRLLAYSNIANSTAYMFIFFVSPCLIALGMKIAGKSLKINAKKELFSALCVSVLFIILNSVYPISYNFIKKTGEPIEAVKAGVAVIVILTLSFVGGIILRKIAYSKILFTMINLSFFGITFCFFFNSFFLRAFCGAEMMFELFFKLAFQKNPVMMFFIPPLFVLLGSFIGRKLIKEKSKDSIPNPENL